MLNTTKWLETFESNLYPDNTFYFGTTNDSAYVSNLSIIIPNYQEEITTFNMGAAAGSYPRTVKELSHTEKVYSMTQYGVDPYMVDPVEDNEFSYDKRLAVMNQAIDKLNTDVANKILWEWTVESTGSVISSTGTATRLNRFGNTVKRITFADIQKMATMLNLQNVPAQGRRLIVDAYGLEDIQVMTELQGSPALTQEAFANGAVMRVAGFDVFMRSESTGFTGAGAKKALGAVDAATDLSSAIAFHPSMVRHAVGTKFNSGIKIFLGQEEPTVYGRLFSAYIRVGGSTSYVEANNITKGIITLVESV